MKKNYIVQKTSLSLIFICFLCSMNLSGQTMFLHWDSYVGCENYEGPREKIDFSDIEEGICVRVCEGSEVTYTIEGGTWTQIDWAVSGGTSTSNGEDEIIVNWGDAGWGSVSLSIYTPEGVIEKTLCIEIMPGPDAKFGVFPDISAEEITRCLGETIYFTNLSDPDQGSEIISYFWDFGNNTSSSEFEPSVTYQEPGTYEVKLKVTNACGCSSNYSMKVIILEEQGVKIECNTVTCEDRIETYSLVGDYHCSEFNWQIQGGQIISEPNLPTIDVTWDDPINGFGYLTFDPDLNHCEAYCLSATTIKVPVVELEGNIEGNETICEKEQYLYKLPEWPSTMYDWSIVSGNADLIPTDQPNQIAISANSMGTIKIRCYYQNSLYRCGGTAELKIEVKESIEISGAETVCMQDVSTYSLPGGLSGQWTLQGPQNYSQNGLGYDFIANFPYAGNYTLTVAGSNFCVPEPLLINAQEMPEELTESDIEGPSEVCPNNTYTFSVPNVPPGNIVLWSTGNGAIINGPSQGNEISVSFQQNGSYTVTAQLQSSLSPYCTSDPVSITPSPLELDMNINGQTILCQNSYEIYTADPVDPLEVADSFTWSIDPPTLGGIVSGQGTDQVEILWYNGNGISSGSLIVEASMCGQVFTEQLTVTPQYAPIVTIVSDADVTSIGNTICRDETLHLSFTSNPPLTSSNISWNFDNGDVGTGNNVSYSYNTVDDNNLSYTITLSIEDALVNGCVMDIQQTYPITVLPAPVAYISPAYDQYFDTTNDIVNVTLSVTEESGLGSNANIQWFQDGVPISVPGSNPAVFTLPQQFASYYAVLTHPITGCTTTTNTVDIEQRTDEGSGDNGEDGCNISFTPELSLVLSNDCGNITATLVDAIGGNPAPESVVWMYYPNISITTNSPPYSITVPYTEAGNYQFMAQAEYICTIDGSGAYYTSFIIDNIDVPYVPGLKYSIACGTVSGTYDVTLYDDSNYFSLATINSWEYTLTNQQSITMTTDEPVTYTNVSPGQTLQATLTIDDATNPNLDPCTVSIEIVVPNLPQAQIDTGILPSEICKDNAVAFAPVTVNPDYIYEWTWFNGNDLVSVSLPTPELSFGTAGNNLVTLTVTDRYGCSATDNWSGTINDSDLGGVITDSGPVCEGENITLTYSPDLNSDFPDHFQWMKGQTPVPGAADAATLEVTQPGSYHVIVWNDENCYQYNIGAVSPVFIPKPTANILGPLAVCMGEEFSLSSAFSDPSGNYSWYLNGIELSGASDEVEISQLFQNPGIYHYKLVVSLNGCTNSIERTVTVYPNPPAPHLDFHITDCDIYTIELTADAGEQGYYLWSNGMSGSTISVHKGGAYEVVFTSAATGCSSSAQFDVPHHPSRYIWMFPSGCYEMCRGQSGIILNPIIPFHKWQEGILPAASQGGMIPPYSFGSQGAYQLHLENEGCAVTSDPLVVSLNPEGCKPGEAGFVSATATQIASPDGECNYEISVMLGNYFSGPVQYMMYLNSATEGTITSGNQNGVIPGGGNFVSVVLTVDPVSGFSGSTMTLHSSFYNINTGEYFYLSIPVNVPPCPIPRPTQTDTGLGNFSGNSFTGTLDVVPNPTKGIATIRYRLGSANDGAFTLSLYDTMGREIASLVPDKESGTWETNLSGYAEGLYIVVLRKNGKVVQQTKIILIQ